MKQRKSVIISQIQLTLYPDLVLSRVLNFHRCMMLGYTVANGYSPAPQSPLWYRR